MTSSTPAVIIVHDLFGTLFGLEAPTEALRKSYPQLSPLRAHSIILDWYQCFQRDLATLSSNDEYQPASVVFKETLPRALKQAGLSTSPSKEGAGTRTFDPVDESIPGVQQTKGAERENPYSSDITQPILDSLQQLTPRPGFVEAFTEVYRSATEWPAKVQIWAATNGGAELGRKLLLAGTGGSDEHGGELRENQNQGVGIFSCDDIRISKPDPRVYAALRSKIGLAPSLDKAGGQKDGASIWFVASHTWDLFAARRAGFKTCWISYEEFYACPAIYGQPDIVACDLAQGAKAIAEWERKHHGGSS
ncbi:hypothetical protein CF319_g2895 [Tilletia indica]|nr:hypothetical protein CF319_g2895 [Tilletia indica]